MRFGLADVRVQQVIAQIRAREIQRRPDLVQHPVAVEEFLPDRVVVLFDLADDFERVEAEEREQHEQPAEAGEEGHTDRRAE